MIEGTNLSAQQELVYLLQFTSGKPKILVEQYRNRRLDAKTALQGLWVELVRRFGSLAVVSNAYIAQLTKAAALKKAIVWPSKVFLIYAKI